jgi:hypothetical protein
MKRVLLFALLVAIAVWDVNAQQHFLKFEDLYTTIVAEGGTTDAPGPGPATVNSATKYLLNDDRELDIFKLVSPSSRTFRIDKANIKFANGVETTVRLETNGSSNSTNGRKIYVTCPSAGTLTVGGYAESDNRGYTLENEAGDVVLSETAKNLYIASLDKQNIPVQTFAIEQAGIVVLNPNAAIYYGFLQFDVTSSDVSIAAEGKAIRSVEYFNVLGSPVSSTTTGLVIVKTTYRDGSLSVKKTCQRP